MLTESSQMSFPLLKLVDVPFLHLLQCMDTIDLIRLSETNSRIKSITKRHVSLGKADVMIMRGMSSIAIGNFVGIITKLTVHKPTKTERIGNFSLDISDQSCSNYVRWFSKSEDYKRTSLCLTRSILDSFPRTKLEHFFSEIDSSVIQPLSTWNLNKVPQCKLVTLTDNSDVSAGTFVESCSKDRHVKVIHTSGNNDMYKVSTIKSFGRSSIPVQPADWFEYMPPPSHKIQFVQLSHPNITEEHIKNIIEMWIDVTAHNLIFVRATDVKSLDIRKIVNGMRTHEWDNDTMEPFRSKLCFSKYFDQNGLIVYDKFGKIATLHLNQEQRTISFVVWNSTASDKTLSVLSGFDC